MQVNICACLDKILFFPSRAYPDNECRRALTPQSSDNFRPVYTGQAMVGDDHLKASLPRGIHCLEAIVAARHVEALGLQDIAKSRTNNFIIFHNENRALVRHAL